MTDLLLRPRFEYSATPVIVILSLPQKLWTPEEGPALGDEDKSAASIPVGYFVGWEYAIGTTIRFKDSEFATVMTMLRWMLQNKSTAFLWRFDAAIAGTQYSVYLEEPRLGADRIKPTRDSKDQSVWELNMKLRSSTGVPIHYALPIG